MAAVKEETAIDTAISAVTLALIANLPAHLLHVDIAVPGLSLKAPDSFYNVGSRDFVEFQLTNSRIACFVYQLDPSEVDEDTITSGPLGYRAEHEVTIEIVLGHRTPQEEPFVRDGRTLTSAERAALRNHRYNAGIIRTLRTNVVGTGGIIDVDKISDFADAVFVDDEGRPLRGFATSQWSLTQLIDVQDSC